MQLMNTQIRNQRRINAQYAEKIIQYDSEHTESVKQR